MHMTFYVAFNHFVVHALFYESCNSMSLTQGIEIIFHLSPFKIRLSTQRLLRLLLKEICIFSNVCQQIIAESKLSKQH